MGESKKIAIENYQKFQSVAYWSHRSEKIKSAKKCCPLPMVSLLPIGLTHCTAYDMQHITKQSQKQKNKSTSYLTQLKLSSAEKLFH